MRNNLLILLLLSVNFCKAQIRMSYSIGCVGNTNLKTPVFSSSVAINGKGCFMVANGIRSFEKGKPGVFVTSCEIANAINAGIINDAKLSMRLFPNPVITSFTIRSLYHLQPKEILSIAVYDMSGNAVRKTPASGQQLNDGINIDISGSISGIYVVKVSSLRASIEFKLIKIN